jgi:small-conductance mechanosensitive channel
MDELIRIVSRTGLTEWGATLAAAARIVAIVIGAWVLIALLQRTVRRVRQHIAARLDSVDGARRAETVGRVIRYLVALVVGSLAVMLVLGELGISLAPILGAAGVVGLAIGFGAQTLVKDYFTGFFILFEDQIRSGDVVRVAGIAGVVEDITLRHVRLRDYDGQVHFVPNGLITTVTNMGRGFAQAVIDVGVAYRVDVDDALDVMREVGAELRADPVLGPKILADLEIAGVERLDDSAVVLRCRFKVLPLEQWTVRREFLRRLKAAFDRRGIEIPFPHLTVYAGTDRGGEALPLRVLDAGPTSARSDAVGPPSAASATPR